MIGRSLRLSLLSLALALGAAAAAAPLEGCSGPPALVQAADQMANTTVGPEYELLVTAGYGAVADPSGRLVVTQTLTAAQREDRLRNLRSFRDAVAAAKGPGPTGAQSVVKPGG